MKTIIYEGQKYNVPEGWHEVTVEHYQKIHGKTGTALIAGLIGISEDALSRMPLSLIKDQLNPLTAFVKTERLDAIVKRFTHEGKEYSCLPSITQTMFGQFIDCEKITAEAKPGDMSYMAKVISILYQPVEDEKTLPYDILKTDEMEKAFMRLPMTIAFGCINFFLILSAILNTNSRTYLTSLQVRKGLILQELKKLESGFDGTGLPLNYRAILRKQIRLLSLQ
jgi:hypothetical protein